MTQPAPDFQGFLDSLQHLTGVPEPVSPEAKQPYEAAAAALQSLDSVDQQELAALIQANPSWVPILASIAGLSQEQLKNVLRHRLGTSGWITLAREHPQSVIEMLDIHYGLVGRIEEERSRSWSYGDILFERVESRSRASRAIGRGRDLEDEVEEIVKSLGLPYALRTHFTGTGGRTAPCDLAIPVEGPGALIVCAVKGFDSTGSKLTNAVREVESMASVREPQQFVYAIVDGIGWLSPASRPPPHLQALDPALDRRDVLTRPAARLPPRATPGSHDPPAALSRRGPRRSDTGGGKDLPLAGVSVLLAG